MRIAVNRIIKKPVVSESWFIMTVGVLKNSNFYLKAQQKFMGWSCMTSLNKEKILSLMGINLVGNSNNLF